MKWVVQPGDIEIGVGKPLHVPCIAGGSPEPSIEWTRVGDEKTGFVGRELRFVSVSQQDAGYYECRAKNGVEKDLVARMKLNVLGK